MSGYKKHVTYRFMVGCIDWEAVVGRDGDKRWIWVEETEKEYPDYHLQGALIPGDDGRFQFEDNVLPDMIKQTHGDRGYDQDLLAFVNKHGFPPE